MQATASTYPRLPIFASAALLERLEPITHCHKNLSSPSLACGAGWRRAPKRPRRLPLCVHGRAASSARGRVERAPKRPRPVTRARAGSRAPERPGHRHALAARAERAHAQAPFSGAEHVPAGGRRAAADGAMGPKEDAASARTRLLVLLSASSSPTCLAAPRAAILDWPRPRGGRRHGGAADERRGRAEQPRGAEPARRDGARRRAVHVARRDAAARRQARPARRRLVRLAHRRRVARHAAQRLPAGRLLAAAPEPHAHAAVDGHGRRGQL